MVDWRKHILQETQVIQEFWDLEEEEVEAKEEVLPMEDTWRIVHIVLISTWVLPGYPFQLKGVHLQEGEVLLLRDLPVLMEAKATVGWEDKDQPHVEEKYTEVHCAENQCLPGENTTYHQEVVVRRLKRVFQAQIILIPQTTRIMLHNVETTHTVIMAIHADKDYASQCRDYVYHDYGHSNSRYEHSSRRHSECGGRGRGSWGRFWERTSVASYWDSNGSNGNSQGLYHQYNDPLWLMVEEVAMLSIIHKMDMVHIMKITQGAEVMPI